MTEQQSILIVDDDQFTLGMHCEAFKGNYRVLSATSGEEALVKARNERPDLIILDVVMPEMNGYEVLRRLKLQPKTRDIPVVFLTSMNQEYDETLGLKLGAIDYWVKPFNHVIGVIRASNLLELKRSRDRLAELALEDGLTGITNRRGFDELWKQEWSRSTRTTTPLALLLADVDDFKLFNDTYGHTAGDYCLRSIATVFQDNLHRSTDRVARYGGEEFAFIFPATDQVGAVEIAERLRKGVEALCIPNEKSGPGGMVTASFGVAALIPTPQDREGAQIDLADQALYRAKANGRNQVVSAPTFIRKVS